MLTQAPEHAKGTIYVNHVAAESLNSDSDTELQRFVFFPHSAHTTTLGLICCGVSMQLTNANQHPTLSPFLVSSTQ